jgi:hypothetical protein
MGALEQTLRGPEIEVPAKATRRRFTLEYKRKIVREADGCKRSSTTRRCESGCLGYAARIAGRTTRARLATESAMPIAITTGSPTMTSGLTSAGANEPRAAVAMERPP